MGLLFLSSQYVSIINFALIFNLNELVWNVALLFNLIEKIVIKWIFMQIYYFQ